MRSPLLAAIGDELGETLGRSVMLQHAQPIGRGYVAQAANMMDTLLADA
jgi:hypothetical protein